MQADAILAMQLQRLTGLEADKLTQEYVGLKADIAGYERILADENLILDIIRADLRELKDKYADRRRSVISDEELGDFDKEALIREAIAATGAISIKDMGKVMGAVKAKAQGRADMAEVSARIKQRLNG